MDFIPHDFVTSINALHDETTRRWHDDSAEASAAEGGA